MRSGIGSPWGAQPWQHGRPEWAGFRVGGPEMLGTEFSFQHVDHRTSVSFLVSTGPRTWGRYWGADETGRGLWQGRHHFGECEAQVQMRAR